MARSKSNRPHRDSPSLFPTGTILTRNTKHRGLIENDRVHTLSQSEGQCVIEIARDLQPLLVLALLSGVQTG